MKGQRKAVTAQTPVDFTFDVYASQFLVKNFTEDDITVALLDNEVLIPAKSAQMVVTCLEPREADLTNTLTVTAEISDETGVEIQCLNY